MAGGFWAGSAFLLYLSTIFLRHASVVPADLWFVLIFVLVAAFSAGLGVRAWRSRHTPFTVERNGRVSYGENELCAPKTVQSVRIGPSRAGEAGDCEVYMELRDGKLVAIPSQYFGSYKDSTEARPFADAIARILGVPVTE
jgi:hypothetical protein